MSDNTSEVQKLYEERDEGLGVVRLERWPEGFVLWVGGTIQWTSFVRNIRAAPEPFKPRFMNGTGYGPDD